MTEDEREGYLHGRCHVFAIAMHRASGLPLRVALAFDGEGNLDYLTHAWVEWPDGRMLDAAGLRDVGAALEAEYGDDGEVDVQEATEEFLSRTGEGHSVEALVHDIGKAMIHAQVVLAEARASETPQFGAS